MLKGLKVLSGATKSIREYFVENGTDICDMWYHLIYKLVLEFTFICTFEYLWCVLLVL